MFQYLSSSDEDSALVAKERADGVPSSAPQELADSRKRKAEAQAPGFSSSQSSQQGASRHAFSSSIACFHLHAQSPALLDF